MTSEDISIEIDYGCQFRERVAERKDPDPLLGMKIRADGTFVLGDETHAAKDSISTNLTVQLEATEQILDNKKAVIEYMNGPMWLVFEPHDEEMVKITGCATIEGVRDPKQRLSVDTTVLVSKTAWIFELIETAEEFHEKVVDLNSDLKDDQILRRLRREIETAREQLEEFEAR